MKAILLMLFLLVVTAGINAQVVFGISGEAGVPMLKFADVSQMKVDRAVGGQVGAPINARANFIMTVGRTWLGSKSGDYINGTEIGVRLEWFPIVRPGRNAFMFLDMATANVSTRLSGVKKSTDFMKYGAGLGIAQPVMPGVSFLAGLHYHVTDLEKLDHPLKFTPAGFAGIRYEIRGKAK